jgi:hypothetical protein
MAMSETERAVERVAERYIASGVAGALAWFALAIIGGVLFMLLGLPAWPAMVVAIPLALWVACIVDGRMRGEA